MSQRASEHSRRHDRALIRGIAWTSAAKWGGQGLSWISTLVVARVLTPEDYGLVGMASIYLGLIALLSEFGLGSAVSALRDLSEEQLAQLNGFAILFGFLSFVVSCVAAVPLGRFFHSQELPEVVMVMSFGFVVTAFGILPSATLRRDLRFRALALIDAVRAMVLACSMVALAYLGYRYWTLVVGGLLSSVLVSAQTLALRRHRAAWPRRAVLQRAMNFGRQVVVERLAWFTYSNADFVVAGRILGKTALGVYEVAWTVANMPVEKIGALISQVTFPVFAAVQDDLPALRRYFLGITEGLALLTFPAATGLVLVAHDFVLAFLGAKWEGAVRPMELLSALVAVRSIVPLLPALLQVMGDVRYSMWNAVTTALVMPIAFYFMGTRWGTTGLALAWIAVYPVVPIMLYIRVFQRLDLRVRDYLVALWPAASSSLVMVAAVGSARRWALQGPNAAIALAVQVGVGALAYVFVCLTVHRARVRAFYVVLRSR